MKRHNATKYHVKYYQKKQKRKPTKPLQNSPFLRQIENIGNFKLKILGILC